MNAGAAALADVVGEHTLGERLEARVKRGANRASRSLLQYIVRKVRRAERQLAQRAELQRHRDVLCRVRGLRMRFDPSREQSLPRAAQLFAFTTRWCPPRGRLRNQYQRQGFGDIESRSGLVEVDLACGADALDVAAIGHQVDVGLQQLALGVAHLQLHCARDLLQLAADAARVQVVHQSRELHRDRRAADARTPGIARQRCSHERRWIESGVTIEVPVLVHQQRIDELRRHLVERRPQSILLIARERQPQQPALLIEDCGRRRNARCKRLARREANDDHSNSRKSNEPQRQRCDSPVTRHGRDTASLPAAERPTTLLSYIASP